jgi:thioesterase domain-containing protein/acyl carrier protein
LSHHPSVTEAVVVAHQRAATDKMLVAYLVPRQAILPSPSEMRIYLQAQLPAYMIPAAFVEVESLPLTSSGKVDRQALPAPSLHPLGVHDAYLAPRNALEQQLVQIWEDLLHTRPIGIHDNFFDLGGHSLLVVRLLVRLQRELGQTLPVSALFQASTIADLAQALQEPTPPPQASSSVIPLQLQGHRPPFFCVHGLGGDVLSFLALARHLAPLQPFYGLQHPGLEQPFAVNRLENLAAYYLKEIRQIQPQGPYIIGGWSLGAIVAFEMAQQLVASGHAVSQLLLLDTAIETQPYATPTPTMRSIPEDDLLPLLVSLGERAHGADGAAFLPQLAHDLDMTPEAFIHAVYRLMQHRASDEATEWRGALGQLSRHVDVFKASLEAATCYQPQVYPGKMTLFRATESDELFSLSSKPGWEDLASEGVTVVSVPGNHHTMLQDPHVQVLADRLHTCLEHIGARDTQ